MPRLLKDAETFEFLTEAGHRLELFGELLGWQDEIVTGVIEHRLYGRSGALHQRSGAPPRRFVFSCALLGPEVHARWNEIVDAVDESPLGSLIHPRFGFRPAACDGLSAKETPGEAVDAIFFTMKFSEDGLREPPAPSPAAAASAASLAAAQLTAAALPFTAAAQLQAAVVAARIASFQQVIADVTAGAGTVPGLLESLRAVRGATDAIAALAPAVAQYPIRAAAALVVARALEAYNAVRIGLPAVLSYRVPGQTSIAALAARLYGGRFARAQAETIQLLNRIPRPYDVAPGTMLLLYDPRSVRAAA